MRFWKRMSIINHSRYKLKAIVLCSLYSLWFVSFVSSGTTEEVLYQIKEVEVTEKDGFVKVVIGATNEPQYKYFQLQDPPRLVIDFLNATSLLIDKKIPVARTSIQCVRSIQFRNEPVKIVRVVIDLKESLDYRISTQDNKVVVLFSKGTQTFPETAEVIRARVKERIKQRVKICEEIEVEKKLKSQIERKPLVPPVVEEPRISLDLKDADLIDVLRLISHKAAVNIVPNKDVSGKVSIRLENVPWEQALDVILKSQGYTYICEKGLIRVGKPEEFALEMTTKVVPLKYAKATAIMESLESYRKGIGATRGWIGTDSRTNSLIITDTAKNIAEMCRVIKELDIRTRQVLIESKIVEISKSGLKELGLTWSVDDAKDSTKYTKHPIGFDNRKREGSFYVDEYTRGQVKLMATPPEGTGGSIGYFSFGFLAGNFNVDMALSALERKGEVNVLSSPAVLTTNYEEAVISVGTQIPMKKMIPAEKEREELVTYEYRSVSLSLTVTPIITPDDYILLKVKPTIEEIGERIIPEYPNINIRSVTTNILLKDGDTVVIGGLTKEKESITKEKIPFFGDIPLLGHLFRRKVSSTEQTELLVFIRTKIIKERE